MRIITNKSELRQALSRILDPSQHSRHIVSAFVGRGKHLDALPKDLCDVDVTCWLKPGATDPNALRHLKSRRATLRSVDKLHIKAYWSAAGALIGSANLTANGFLDDGLHEAMVEYPAGAFEESLFAHLESKPISDEDLIEFEKLHVEYLARNDGCEFLSEGRMIADERSFKDWVTSHARPPWLLLVYSETYRNIGAASHEKLKELKRAKTDVFFMTERGRFAARNWVLLVRTGLKKGSPDGIKWMYADFKTDSVEEHGSEEWVQAYETSSYGAQPFTLDDPTKRAIRETLDEQGLLDRDIETVAEPSSSLIKAVRARLG